MGKKLTQEEFIEKAKQTHGEKYDYSKTIYVYCEKSVIVICPVHGEFQTIPSHHIHRGDGCPKCGDIKMGLSRRLTQKEFIEFCQKKHKNLYDYSLVKYTTFKNKVIIICKKHGQFLQIPDSHCRGIGCPSCNESKGEKRIKEILEKYNIQYERQKKFDRCKDKRKLSFDFYLPKYNILIEYNGKQHYQIINGKYNHNKKDLENLQQRDKIKSDFCEKEKIPLLIIPYTQYKNIEQIIIDYLHIEKI